MDDLVRWLGEQLDEDERIARAAEGDPVFDGTGIVIERNRARGFPDRVAGLISPVATHIAAHDPARVLREIDAKRQLVERYERAMENRRAHPDDLASAGALLALHGAVKLLALPYADRDGYAEAIASFE